MTLTDLQQRNVLQAPEGQRASLTSLYESENSPSRGAAVPVPNQAPTGQVSTTQPVANPVTPSVPVTVVGSGTAKDFVDNKITPALNGATKSITDANAAKKAAETAANPLGTAAGKEKLSAADEAAKAISDTPDAGYKFAYSTKDGSRTQVLANQTTPAGLSDINPATAQASDTTTTGGGLTIKAFADGTYGRFDVNGNYIGQTNQQEFQNSKNEQDTLTRINQIANGTYPLTPTQQAQVDGLKAQFQELLKQQEIANKNFTGGTTVAQNLYGIGNTIMGIGAIKDSVVQGVAKIADLQVKMTSAVAQMTDAFQSENMSNLKSSYDAYHAASKELQTAIDKAHDDMVAAAKDARDYNLNLAKFQEQTQNDAFSQDLETKKFTETQKMNAFDKMYKMEDLALKRRANDIMAGNIDVPVIPVAANGKPDPDAQAKFLATLPPGTAAMVKSLANYTTDPKNLSLKGNARTAMLTLTHQYDPGYDESQYPARAAYAKKFTSGQISDALAAANKSINHLTSFANDVSGLGNGFSTTLNTVLNPLVINSGFRETKKQAQTEANGLKDELAKFFKGTGTTDVKSIEDWSDALSTNLSPAELRGTVQGAITLLSGQLHTVEQQYVDTMGHPPTNPLIQPDTAAKLSTLKNQGYQVDIPGVLYTDVNAYKKYDTSAQSNMTEAISRLQAINMPITPENILQMAQSLNQ